MYRFFHLNLVDLYPEELMSEIIITCELITVFHIFAFGAFSQDSGFATSQRLKCPPQLSVL